MTTEQIKEQMCDEYCRYPREWDEETEGCTLAESKICLCCPLNRIEEQIKRELQSGGDGMNAG